MRVIAMAGWLCVATVCALHAADERSGGLVPAKDALTPVTAALLAPNAPPLVAATDGRVYAVYELVLTNALRAPATIVGLAVSDAASPAAELASYQDAALLDALRNPSNTKAPGDDAVLAPNTVRLFLLGLAFAPQAAPQAVVHRLDLIAAANPATSVPSHLAYTVAPVRFDTRPLPALGPPLRGKGWVVTNGCCGSAQAHRSTFLPVNGALFGAQRFAIDYMRLDDRGRLVAGDEADVRAYPGYGADVIAAADGIVVAALDALDDQVPGRLPDPATITVANVDGNHIVIDIGGGRFAFYAHLRRGSLKVKPGDKVLRGQTLASLGNTGNTSAPHLHFHLMDRASPLGSDGLPYLIDAFALHGAINRDRFAAAKGVEGDYSDGVAARAIDHAREFPLDLQILDFAAR